MLVHVRVDPPDLAPHALRQAARRSGSPSAVDRPPICPDPDINLPDRPSALFQDPTLSASARSVCRVRSAGVSIEPVHRSPLGKRVHLKGPEGTRSAKEGDVRCVRVPFPRSFPSTIALPHDRFVCPIV